MWLCAQVGSVEIPVSPDALYPAVGMHSLGEEVLLDLNAEWGMEEDDGLMIVDSHEEDWARLHDVKVTGTVSRGQRDIRWIIQNTFTNKSLPVLLQLKGLKLT